MKYHFCEASLTPHGTLRGRYKCSSFGQQPEILLVRQCTVILLVLSLMDNHVLDINSHSLEFKLSSKCKKKAGCIEPGNKCKYVEEINSLFSQGPTCYQTCLVALPSSNSIRIEVEGLL